MNHVSALYAFDRRYLSQPQDLIAGVDEVGRGPLAGPVVASAVIFFPNAPQFPVQDSKKLSPKTRRTLFHQIIRFAFVGMGMVDESEIDRINIYQATRVAMKKALLSLPQTPNHVLIDGTMKLDISYSQQAIVKGDTKSASIAAASIVAKVFRDEWMNRLEALYPDYGFSKHKGYGTPEHLEKMQKAGPSPVHRRSFAPVQKFFKPLSL